VALGSAMVAMAAALAQRQRRQPIGDSQLCRLRFKLVELQPCAFWMEVTLDHLEAHQFLQ
jgi:hypothetical protein